MSSATPTPNPTHCRIEAFDLFAQQLHDLDDARNLTLAATAIAMHEQGEIDPQDVIDELDQLANKIAARLQSSDPRAILAHAHEVLFTEERLRGCRHDYYDPKHSYLPAVLKMRRGLPIVLCLIYKYILEQLGIPVQGVGVPGHFIVQLDIYEMQEAPPAAQLIDPFFSGRLLSEPEIIKRALDMTGRSYAPEEALRPVNPQGWLRRIINNLIKSFDQRQRFDDIAAMHELLTLIAIK
ncbi:transglutaminase family protein [Poriferisphaera sp. WC338]|uniref:transglutaminase family protein n=1 Tax=Poriferisphaera sp. WC338 TaxID=3425129 RepID=UPI003D8155CC